MRVGEWLLEVLSRALAPLLEEMRKTGEAAAYKNERWWEEAALAGWWEGTRRPGVEMLLLGHDGRFLFSFFRVAFLSRFVFPSRLFPRDWLGREIYLVLYPSSAMCCFKKTQKLCVSSTPWENLNPSDFVKKLLNEKCTV